MVFHEDWFFTGLHSLSLVFTRILCEFYAFNRPTPSTIVTATEIREDLKPSA